MRTFRALVAYDGTSFHGWQVQPGLRTVQGTLEEALGIVLGDKGLRTAGAGRTDAGVHARGQAMSFRADTDLPAHALRPLLNKVLPDDVRVREVHDAPERFHARHSACARRYAYRLLDADDVLLSRMAWWPRRRFDPDRLSRATAVLEGDTDCSSFRSAGSTQTQSVCRVMRATWRRDGAFTQFDIMANHFLYRMVRNIVAWTLAIPDDRDPAEAMRDVLAARDRSAAGRTAPACGLTLEAVYFDEGST